MKKLLTVFAAALCLLSCSKKDEYVPVNMIGLNTFDLQLTIEGGSKGVQATVLPSNATNQELSWVSQDESVATVSQKGLVTPVSVGETWVVVTARDNGVSTRFKVTVNDVGILVKYITLEPQEMTRHTDSDVKKFSVNFFPDDADDKTLVWTSSDENVVIVSNGAVAPMGVGTATIKAVAKVGGASATCSVQVKAQGSKWVNAEAITLDKVRLSLYPGQTYLLKQTVLPYEADVKDVIWETTDENVASVVGGLVFANTVGTATITARTRDGGFMAYCAVTVVDPEE